MKMAPSSSREHIKISSSHCRRLFFFLNLAAVLVILSVIPGGAQARPQAPVGYGPKFDACGDNCQTQLLHFCTQGRDAQQQRDCWCGEDSVVDNQFVTKMDGCLASCDPQVTDTAVQRNQILRYKQVVCKGSTAQDKEFGHYYSTRFGGNFVPQATAAAPPPPSSAMKPTTIATITRPLVTTNTPSSTRNPSSTRTRPTESSTEASGKSTSTRPTPTRSTASSETEASTSASTPAETSTAESPETPTFEEPVPTPTSSDDPDVTSLPIKDGDETLTASQIAGISVGAVSGFALILLCGLFFFRFCRGRDSKEPPAGKRFSTSSRGEFSPISPMAQQMRDTPDGFSPDLTAAQRFKRALAAFLAWRPETGKFDIEDQLPYAKNSSGSPAPEPPIIRVHSPRKLSISPPMMMAGASLGTGIPPHTLREVTASPEPAVLAGSRSTTPQRKDVILPPIPVVAGSPAEEAHAITTPSGYGDPNFYTYYGTAQQRPNSEATEMEMESSECSSDYSNSEWTDYDESTFNRSASQAAIDALVQEVDRRNQRLMREGSRSR